jgi:DNA-binding NtrC family response regulator
MRRKILLGEGDEHIQELVKEQVERTGFEILLAKNGEEALRLFQKERDSLFMIVLDMDLSELNGERCLEEIKKIDPGASVFLSTFSDLEKTPAEKERLLCKGALMTLQKSSNFLDFFRKLGNLLN